MPCEGLAHAGNYTRLQLNEHFYHFARGGLPSGFRGHISIFTFTCHLACVRARWTLPRAYESTPAIG